MWLTEGQFVDLVVGALDELPEEIAALLDNVDVIVEDWPSRQQLADVGAEPGSTLLGLYEGIPRTDRSADYSMVLPDKITIFRGPILQFCRTDQAVAYQVRQTVVHELAHHLGIDDDRLHELGAY